MYRILHLSDIHFNIDKKKHYFDSMTESLIKDLSTLNKSKQIDFILITGDLIDKGGLGYDNINSAFQAFETEFINPITESIALDKSRVLFVPGNHDIDRKTIKHFSEVGIANLLINDKSVNDAIINDDSDLTIRIKSFKDFEREYRNKYPSKKDAITNFQSTHIFDDGCNKIGFACINSSWRCSGSENEKIIIGSNQVLASIQDLQECSHKILLSHYSEDSLQDFENTSFQERILNEFDIACFGHKHKSLARLINHGEKSVFYSTIRGDFEFYEKNIDFIFGYAILDFITEVPNKVIYSMKLYDNTNNNFYTYHKEDNIEHIFPSKNISDYSPTTIIKSIKENYFPEIDTHLLSYNTDSNAPKTIKDIFVQPLLNKKLFYKKEDLDVKTHNSDLVTIDDILKSKEHCLIFGIKESGKTLILDKLLMDSIENYYESKYIPILIDFNEIKYNLNKNISEFLRLDTTISSSFCNQEHILLLVDNLNYKNIDDIHKSTLFKYLTNHPQTILIATINQDFEGDIPFDVIEHFNKMHFNTFKIEQFKTKQIRELTKMWFGIEDNSLLPKYLTDLSDILKLIDIPNTPLSISLLLYLIEKEQKKKPKNMADMLENYIENLFQKSEKSIVYSNEWNYSDIIKTLSSIAKLMLEHSEENYSIQLGKIHEFIKSYLNDTGQTIFNSEEILNQLINSGILVKKNSRVSFRFACFFEFFLMKKMVFDKTFKETVFDKDNYYKYINEIDYFTALNEDTDILIELKERLDESYLSINTVIDKIGKEFDNLLIPITQFSKSLDENKFQQQLQIVKSNQDELDKLEDEIYEIKKINSKIELKEDLEMDNIRYLLRTLKITAKVLKNTISANKQTKAEVLNSILRCSLSFSFLNQIYILKDIERNINSNDKYIRELYMIYHFLPYIIESMLYDFLGTKRLNDVLKEIADDTFKNKKSLEYTKFLIMLLYYDINGEDSYKFITKHIEEFRKPIFYDSIIAKFVVNYFFKSHNSKTDSEILDILSRIISHAKGIGKDKLNQTRNDLKLKALSKKKELGDQLFNDF